MLCVPHNDPTWSRVTDISEVRPSLLDEIAHFFEVYKDLEPGKHVIVGSWEGKAEAMAIYERGHKKFLEQAASSGTPFVPRSDLTAGRSHATRR